MIAAFTPGPWFIQQEQSPTTPSTGRSETLAVHDAHGGRIALPAGDTFEEQTFRIGELLHDVPVDEAIANARLIAAAPELYGALESIIAFKTDPYCKDSNPLQCCRHARKVAAVALAKARGDQ